MGNQLKRKEEGIYIGNQLDKSNLSNPLSRAMVNNFDRKVVEGLRSMAPKSIHEVGCGEARLSRLLVDTFDVPLLGTDFSKTLIRENKQWESEQLQFEQLSIYDLDADRHRRDIVVCCEVLEHLEEPDCALQALHSLNARAYLFSVPREPIWRILNMARGKYWRDWGNTLGHLNHWSPRAFGDILERNGFEIRQRLNPFPWIMVVAKTLSLV